MNVVRPVNIVRIWLIYLRVRYNAIALTAYTDFNQLQGRSVLEKVTMYHIVLALFKTYSVDLLLVIVCHQYGCLRHFQRRLQHEEDF